MLTQPVHPAVDGTYRLSIGADYTAGSIQTVEEPLQALFRQGQPVACDIETFGLGRDALRLKCVSFALPHHAVVLDPRDPAQAALILKSTSGQSLIFHNSPFDIPNLHRNGLIDDTVLRRVWDTLLWARLAYPDSLERKSLEAMAAKHLGLSTTDTMKSAFKRLGLTVTQGYSTMDINSPVFLQGSATDAIITARLFGPLRAAAISTLTENHPFTTVGVTHEEAQSLVDREQHINRTLLGRACRGLRIDEDFLDQYRQQTGKARAAAEAGLTGSGIRPGNATDLIQRLGERLPADYPRTATGRHSTNARDLESLLEPEAQLFVEAKRITKIENDYLGKITELAEDGRIHPVVNLLAATTGRMSIGDPPLQQLPGSARGIILADPGDTLVSIDWSQIEPVIAANIAGDTGLLASYEDGSSDLYTALAERANITRKSAKTTLLAQMYGEGIAKLAHDLTITETDATELRDFVFAAMPATGALIKKLRSIGRDHRRIFTLSGRILSIPMGQYEGQWSVQTHKAVNYFVQGSAYDVLAEAMVRIIQAGLGSSVYLAMHDELVVSQSAAHDIKAIMEQPPDRLTQLAHRVPVLRTDMALLGDRWADA